MLLNRLHMENFKRFRDEEITFHDGITGIVGNNGAGKSTVVEAILFALYGVRSSSLESDYLVSATAGEKEKCAVSLDFNADGVPYTVTRTFRKTASSIQHHAQLVMGEDTLLADGVSRVEEEIPRIIGTGPRDFLNTIYSGQKDLLALLDDKPAERKKWFMHVLGIDVLKEEGDRAIAEEIKRKEERMGKIRYYLDEVNPEALAAEIEALQEKEAGARNELSVLKERLSGLREQEESLEQERQVLTGKKEELIRLQGQISSCKKENDRLTDQQRRMEEKQKILLENREECRRLEESETRYTELARRLETLTEQKSRHDSITDSIDRHTWKKDQLGRQKEEIQKNLAALESDHRRITELEPVMERRRQIDAELEALKKQEEALRPRIDELQHLEARETALEERAQTIREEIASLEERGAGPEAREAAQQHLEACISKRDEVAATCNRLGAQLEVTRQRIAEMSRHRDEIRDAGPDGSCPTCTRPLGDQYSRILADIESEIRDLEEGLGRDDARYRELSLRIQEYDGEIHTARKRLSQAEHDAENLEAACSRRSQLMAEMMDCLSRQEAVRTEIAAGGYAPEKRERLESDLRSTDSAWQDYLACSERVKREQAEQERYHTVDAQIRKEEAEITRLEEDRCELGFDPDEYAAIEGERESLEPVHARYAGLAEALRDLPRIEEELASTAQQIAKNDETTARLREEVKALGSPAEELDRVVADLESCRKQIVNTEKNLSTTQAEIRQVAADLKKREQEQEKIVALQKESESLEDRISLEKTTRRVLSEFISYLLQVVQSQIEGDVSAVLAEITDGRYDQVIIGDDFTPLVADMGEHFPIQRYSGGEQDVIAVALRIALSRYLARLHGTHDATFLIFDEIFGSQDEQRRANLTRALRTQEMHFPQIFLISHVSDLQGEFAHTLMVERTSADESRIREVGL
ncbi:MAG: AAA family ATPase [Methanomicrobiales archaeon]